MKDLFAELEASFSDCTSYSHEIIAADVIGDMAYTVGYEHTQARHRHADTLPDAERS